MYSQRMPENSGISAMPPAMETIIGFAISRSSSAIAVARARCPIPTPLLVARIIVGFSMVFKVYYNSLYTFFPRKNK